jgi:hypothetical protein
MIHKKCAEREGNEVCRQPASERDLFFLFQQSCNHFKLGLTDYCTSRITSFDASNDVNDHETIKQVGILAGDPQLLDQIFLGYIDGTKNI